MTNLILRYLGLVEWLDPPTRNKPKNVLGIGLEFSLIGIHVMIGIGHALLWFRG